METVKLLSFVLKNVCKLNGHLINKSVKKFKKYLRNLRKKILIRESDSTQWEYLFNWMIKYEFFVIIIQNNMIKYYKKYESNYIDIRIYFILQNGK